MLLQFCIDIVMQVKLSVVVVVVAIVVVLGIHWLTSSLCHELFEGRQNSLYITGQQQVPKAIPTSLLKFII